MATAREKVSKLWNETVHTLRKYGVNLPSERFNELVYEICNNLLEVVSEGVPLSPAGGKTLSRDCPVCNSSKGQPCQNMGIELNLTHVAR